MAVEETFDLDITSALSQLDALERSATEAFQRAAEVAASSIADAFAGVSPTVEVEADPAPAVDATTAALDELEPVVPVDADASAVGPEVEGAIPEAATVEVGADASAIPGEVEGAIPTDATVAIDGDASELGGSIDEALAGVTATVAVEADTSGLEGDIEAAVDGVQATVAVGADTSELEGALDGVGGKADATGGRMEGLATSTERFAGAASLARGEAGGLGQAIPGGAGVAAAATGIAALAVTTKAFLDNALEAQTATRVWNQALGESADAVEAIDVGTLHTSIGDLALSMGDDDDAVRLLTARLFGLAEQAGATAEQSGGYVDTLIALAANAKAANPALGSLDQITQGLANGLSRGGRFAQQFGIDITSAEINARALEQTGKRSAAELSQLDKSMAGASIAAERLGPALGENVAAGADSAQIKMASLRQKFSEFTEGLGAALIEPALDLGTALEPVAERIAKVFGQIAAEVVPVAAQIAGNLVPAIDAGADVVGLLLDVLGPFLHLLGDIPAPVWTMVAAFVALSKVKSGIEGLVGRIGSLGSVSAGLGNMLGQLTTGVGLATLAVGAGVAVWQAFGKSHQEAKKRAAEMRDAILADTEAVKGNTDAVGENIAKLIEKRIVDKNQEDDLARAGVTYDELNTAITGTDAQFAALGEKLKAHGELNYGLVGSLVDLRKSYQDGTAAAADHAKVTGDGAAAAKSFAEANDAAAASASRAPETYGNQSAVMRVLFDEIRTGTTSMADFANAATLLNLDPSVIDEFTKAVAEMQAQVVATYTQVIPSAADAMGTALDNVKDKFSLQGVIDQMNAQAGQIAAFYDNVNTLVAAHMDSAAQIILEKGPVAGAQLAQALVDTDDKQRAAFETSVNNYNSQVGRAEGIVTDLAGRLPGVTEQMAKDISAKFDAALKLEGVTGEEADAAKRALENGLAGGNAKAETAGHGWMDALGQGMRAGIARAGEIAAAAAAEVVGRAQIAGRGAMKAFSPSRVWMEMGHDAVWGLAVGLEQNAPLAEAGARSVADAARVVTADQLRPLLDDATSTWPRSARQAASRAAGALDDELDRGLGRVRARASIAANRIQKAIHDQLSTEEFLQIASQTADAIEEAMNRALDAFAAKVPEVGDVLGQLKAKADETLTLDDAIAQLNSQADELTAFYDQVAQIAAAGFDDTARVLLEKGPEAGAQLAAMLQQASADQVAGFEAAVEGYGTAADAAAAKAKEVGGELPSVAQGIAEEATSKFADGLELAGVAEAAALEAQRALIATLGSQGLMDSMSGIGQSIAQAITAGITGGAVGMPGAIAAVRSAAVQANANVTIEQNIDARGATNPAAVGAAAKAGASSTTVTQAIRSAVRRGGWGAH